MRKFFFIIFCFYISLNLPLKSFGNNSDDFKKIAISFLKWHYYTNDTLRHSFGLIDNFELETPDSTKPYRINFEGVNRFIIFLKSPNLLSEQYFKSLKNYFLVCDEAFIKCKQYKNFPLGFGMDFVTKLLANEGIREFLDSSVIIKFIENKNYVKLKLRFTNNIEFEFKFIKENAKWLISEINGAFPKKIECYTNRQSKLNLKKSKWQPKRK